MKITKTVSANKNQFQFFPYPYKKKALYFGNDTDIAVRTLFRVDFYPRSRGNNALLCAISGRHRSSDRDLSEASLKLPPKHWYFDFWGLRKRCV